MALPLPLRNRLADLILDALHDPQARQALEVVAAVCVESGAVPTARPIPQAFPADLFEHREGVWRLKGAWKAYEVEFAERAERARRMLRRRPFDPVDPPLATALVSAALLFHAHLYFEVHELLEPCWREATGATREALQGLIQAAVGYQHLANGNLPGARALLEEGADRLRGRALAGRALDGFARALAASVARVADFDWDSVPGFPG
jgi:hypothetical protein